LPPGELANLKQRGRASLRAWLRQSGPQLSQSDRFEYDFQNESSRVEEIRLAGKVDRIIINERRQTITVVDYKTGRSYSRWQPSVAKLHLFEKQLYFYKLLIENSARFKKYRVEKGVIEFIEPDERGQINRIELIFEDDQLKQIVTLIKTVWGHIQSLKFPDISAYPKSLAGVREFEKDLTREPKTPAEPAGARVKAKSL
jgi:CRISPR/Cas system-associated exonuclease Cas4 (RecB family)